PTVSLAFELRDKLLKISWIFLNLVHVSKINLYLTKRDKQLTDILSLSFPDHSPPKKEGLHR
ncbi:MAG: hypothetical protein ACK5M7_19030, partial [Draconibacterium sp.]